MAKLLYTEYEYKLFKRRVVICGCCHREIKNEPFVVHRHYYAGIKVTKVNRCWHCCRDREATRLITDSWPGVFQVQRRGKYWHLDYDTHFTEFFAGGPE